MNGILKFIKFPSEMKYCLRNMKCPADMKLPQANFMENKKQMLSHLLFIFWRSRRDLNPRYPFGVHTISSRARYDHFDTAPYLVVSQSTRLYYPKDCHLSRAFFIFFGFIFPCCVFDVFAL